MSANGLYEQENVWTKELQLGQKNLATAISDYFENIPLKQALDIGCGNGAVSAMVMKRLGVPISGLDSSKTAIEHGQIPTRYGDATDVPVEDDSYDLVLCTDVLEHLDDADETKAYGELFRVARDYVALAVPFCEHLSQSMMRCSDCGETFHINWHKRAYSVKDFRDRVPAGWDMEAVVLSGEAWAFVDPEIHFLERELLDSYAYWEDAQCTHCGAGAGEMPSRQVTPQDAYVGVARRKARNLQAPLELKSHTEMLMVFRKSELKEITPSLREAEASCRTLTTIDLMSTVVQSELLRLPEVARLIQVGDDEWIAQFPFVSDMQSVEIRWAPATEAREMELSVEGVYPVIGGVPVSAGITTSIPLSCPLNSLSGEFGILLRFNSIEGIEAISLKGECRTGVFATVPTRGEACYLRILESATPWFVQVFESQFLGDDVTNPDFEFLHGLSLDVLDDSRMRASVKALILEEFQRSRLLESELKVLSPEVQARRSLQTKHEEVLVKNQNLVEERAILRRRLQEAEKLVVEYQNMQVEHAALLTRIQEFDVVTVNCQNLKAERDALLERAKEADRLAVECQNLSAERDALLQKLDYRKTQ